MNNVRAAEPTTRLETLLGFLDADPANLSLLGDTALAAADVGDIGQASHLIDRYERAADLSPALTNLRGVIALHEARFADADAILQPLQAANPNDPVLRFNLAWAKEMLGEHEAAADLIDETALEAAPRAAALKVQALHQLGRLDDALSAGERFAQLRPQDRPLMGALATVALDASRQDLARRYAEQAGDSADGLSVLGALALEGGDVRAATTLFDRALDAYPASARGLLGKGLALMANGDSTGAAPLLERAAGIFGTHLGSWVAAGWSWLVAGDRVRARSLFDKALEVDDTFAETHGALAVLDFLEGDLASARQRADVALRLDRKCFSAALARSLLAGARGDEALADRIRKVALNTPISEGGPSLGQAMGRLNGGFRL